MKNNIKTRKQKLLTLLNEAINDNQDYAVDCLLELREEDEGFERELRQELEDFRKAKEDKEHTSGLTQFGMGMEYKIKQVLGEK